MDPLNEGLAHYAAGRALEAHEAFEDLFRTETGRRRQAAKTLAQIAAAEVKLRRDGSPTGARAILERAAVHLEALVAEHPAELGLDLVELLSEVQKAQALSEIAYRPALPAASLTTRILYLHGFASGPSSAKAQILARAFAAEGYPFTIPDQNEGDFRGLTVSRALALARRKLADRTLVIGSSLGGYVAALLAAEDPRVAGLVLMAPAFRFGQRLTERYGPDIEIWRARGSFYVPHHTLGGNHPIGFGLYEDAQHHAPLPTIRVPTYILHGRFDEVVPLATSEEAARSFPEWVQLDAVDDDHGLVASVDRVTTAVRRALANLGFPRTPEENPLVVPRG